LVGDILVCGIVVSGLVGGNMVSGIVIGGLVGGSVVGGNVVGGLVGGNVVNFSKLAKNSELDCVPVRIKYEEQP